MTSVTQQIDAVARTVVEVDLTGCLARASRADLARIAQVPARSAVLMVGEEVRLAAVGWLPIAVGEPRMADATSAATDLPEPTDHATGSAVCFVPLEVRTLLIAARLTDTTRNPTAGAYGVGQKHTLTRRAATRRRAEAHTLAMNAVFAAIAAAPGADFTDATGHPTAATVKGVTVGAQTTHAWAAALALVTHQLLVVTSRAVTRPALAGLYVLTAVRARSAVVHAHREVDAGLAATLLTVAALDAATQSERWHRDIFLHIERARVEHVGGRRSVRL